ncbi:chemotaxis protein CheA [Myxococcus sp. XM-1-1-1]|uniref:chemotaxis protein CheA n=1 Tax=Myxococcus sp. XM-1-1-1 TaxID=2874602 RepID=UPI001CBBDEC1|nr:chemotaxis protein CheA [Myxococcus sp. XM-1-1-1]MBZ4413023.1 chemotaxis protein CheA [Myxococcus sp. XM-1-1-1]
MTMDMSRYLGLFISEATEHLEALGRDLVQLEREGSSSAVDSMFRHAHSVKGMASSMGFEPIAILAHRVEDLVDAVRQDRSRLDRDLVDLLLSASDTLLAQVRAVAEGHPPDEAAPLLAQLAARVTTMTGHAPTATRVAKVTVLKPEGSDGGESSGGSGGGSGTAGGGSGASGSGAGSTGGSGASGSGAGSTGGSGAGGGGASGAGSTGGSGATGGGSSGAGSTDGGAGGGGSGTTGGPGAGSRGATGAAGGAGSSGGASDGAGSTSGVSSTGGNGSPGGTASGPASASGAAPGTSSPSNGPTGTSGADLGPQSPVPPRLTSLDPGVGGVREVLGIGAPASSPHGNASTGAPLGLGDVALNDLGTALKAASTAPLPGERPEGGTQRWAVRLRISPTCQVPGVRAFLVHKRLTTLGTLVDLRPALEELKAGRIPDGYIQLELETSVGEAGIQQSLKNVAEVDVVSVKPAVAVPLPVVAPASAAEAGRGVGADSSSRTVRVRTELLDYFLDTVGELMLATARLREVGKVLPENVRPALEEGVYRLHTLVKDLHDKVMTARMTPLSLITDRLPRAARDIARRKEREVDLVITGAEIELDRAILDELADPLLHLLRNCIDHGLESPEERVAAKKGPRGRVLVAVKRARDRVIIELEDDGRGMNPAKLKSAAVARGLLTPEAAARMTDREAFMLSCLPGVSTAKDVTDISGRGVGMDAVKRVVESVGGTLEIDSETGRGTRFTLRLPLTVAVVHLLLVEVGEEVFGLPIAKVVGATEADSDALSRSRETALLPHGNSLLPVHALDSLVGVPAPGLRGVRPFVVMEGDSGRVALGVDRLLGQEEVVLKPLSRPLDLLPGLSGVTILGSGRPVFILDVPRLLSA